jgi:hypothetical protein
MPANIRYSRNSAVVAEYGYSLTAHGHDPRTFLGYRADLAYRYEALSFKALALFINTTFFASCYQVKGCYGQDT